MRMQIASTERSLRRAWARAAGAAAVAAAVAVGAGCTSQQLDGKSASYLILDALQASPGAEPDQFSGHLRSDVTTEGSVFADNLEVSMRVALKDPGSQASPNVPTTTNWITVTRYSVRFVRADGRNTAGVDVPYPFDGGVTLTALPGGSTTVVTLVRAQAKLEAPLTALAVNTNLISTIAEVTFYGTDQAGRAVSVTGTIGVDFANWADPD
jgi:hypothetical protein